MGCFFPQVTVEMTPFKATVRTTHSSPEASIEVQPREPIAMSLECHDSIRDKIVFTPKEMSVKQSDIGFSMSCRMPNEEDFITEGCNFILADDEKFMVRRI